MELFDAYPLSARCALPRRMRSIFNRRHSLSTRGEGDIHGDLTPFLVVGFVLVWK